MTTKLDFDAVARRFYRPGVLAVALVGSHARGDAGPFSDVDLLCLLDEGAGESDLAGSHLVDGHLVVVSTVRAAEVASWFAAPELAVNTVGGLRQARALLDPSGAVHALRERARRFVWDGEMQARANVWVSAQMVGWIEEVHKGLEGLRRGDTGRLLNARFGLSWGLSRVVQVYHGIMLEGDNGFFEQVERVVGTGSHWTLLRRAAFAIENEAGIVPTLPEQVRAGLRLYVETARLVAGALQPEDTELIAVTVALLRREGYATTGSNPDHL